MPTINIKDNIKSFRSDSFNYNFNMKNGTYISWGKTMNDDPDYCEYGPTILDIEVTERCDGIGERGPCNFCYKANSLNRGRVMSFETFKQVFDKLPKTVTQVAFGADAKCETCPDIFKMMEYCRENDVVPNITVADVSRETAWKLSKYVGAVSVSWYGDWEIFLDSIKNLFFAGIRQINIHNMVSEQTLNQTWELLENRDQWENYINAVVFLSLKKCGRAKKGFDILSIDKYNEIIKYCLDNDIAFGSDSCGCHKIENLLKEHNRYDLLKYIEPCESSCFSFYCNAAGVFYPCSFNEVKKYGIDSKDVNDFIQDVWNNEKTKEFRKKLLACGRKCPTFEV